MQLAIWDIVHDNGDGVEAGIVRRSSNTPVEVVYGWRNYLQLSLGQSSTKASVYLNYDGEITKQPLIGAFNPQSVPEPGTPVLIGSALLLWPARRKRGVPSPAGRARRHRRSGDLAVVDFIGRRRSSRR